MKILLIKPLLSHKSDFMFEPPLGLMYISAYLKSHGYEDIKMIHMDVERVSLSALSLVLREYCPDVIGLSALTAEAESMYQIAALIKEELPLAVIVAGGPHATAYGLEDKESKNIDIIVIGEGEKAFLEILKNLRDTKAYYQIPGICFWHQDHVVRTGARLPVDPVDQLPYPDWGLIEPMNYVNLPSMSRIICREAHMPLFTSRGCPFRCAYCHNIFGKKFRAHSSERVINEIKTIHDKFGITHFEILDDIFNFSKERVISIMQGIIDSGIKIKLFFPNGLRGDILDDELLDLFVRAGVVYISIAVETASPRLQQKLQKYISLPKIKEIISKVSRRKIFVNGFFMLGFPDETFGEVISTIFFALTSRLHSASFFLVHPFKGTQVGRWAEESHKNTVAAGDRNNYAIIDQNSAQCSNFTPIQLRWIFGLVNFLFYCNPVRFSRIVRDLPEKKTLMPLLTVFLSRVLNRDFVSRQRRVS